MKQQQIILITGASSGFGNVTARLLAIEGHTVYASMRNLNGKNLEKSEQLLEWARLHNVDLRTLELDVTSDASVAQARDNILKETGQMLDVVINNAGIYGGGIQESFSVDDHKVFFDVNVLGSVRVNNAFLPVLRKRGSGLIVQISSVLGRTIIPFGGVYDATKWAVEALSENLAYELKPLGIDVVIVEPGPFRTELLQKQYQPSNAAVAHEYGRSIAYLTRFSQAFTSMLTDPDIPNKPEHVAEAIVALINMPAGKRPLRTVVDKMMGGSTEHINSTGRNIQAGILQNLGLEDLVIAN